MAIEPHDDNPTEDVEAVQDDDEYDEYDAEEFDENYEGENEEWISSDPEHDDEAYLEDPDPEDAAIVEELIRESQARGAQARGSVTTEPPADAPTLNPIAFQGLAGDIVRAIAPHTEAAPVAILTQLLVGFGNVVGPGPHFTVEAVRHPLILNVALVGRTSKARKGTSWGHVNRVLEEVDSSWASDCIQNGLSSGEGLIQTVSDSIAERRLLVLDPEFASTLKVMKREGNTLSPVIRQAWDGGRLAVMTRNNPISANGAHIGFIGHITAEELRRCLDQTEAANGFANRFLFVHTERAQLLPEGGSFDKANIQPLVARLVSAVGFARQQREVRRDEQARTLWIAVYPVLSEGRLGLVGSITSRAEAQVMRLACHYALLDQSPVIRRVHLEAALALWRYCEASVVHIFGDATGDEIADKILKGLRRTREGVTRTEISELLSKNVKADRIDVALELLQRRGLAHPSVDAETGGRPEERWFATKETN